MKLLVRNLARSLDKDALLALFTPFGEVVSCNLVLDKETGQSKGFGFIVGDDGAEVFVHYRNVEGLSKRSIKEGQQVSYVVKQSDRGPQAEEVKPL